MVAHAILDGIRSQTFTIAGSPFGVTASIGVALFPLHASAASELLSCADLAMYEAKEQGRNRVSVFAHDLDWQARIESRIGWQHRIREALEHDRFVLHAQPILDIRTGAVSQYELLIRAAEVGGELVLPSVFLGIAERSGLIQEIDRWVVRRAINTLAEQQAAGNAVRFEVNLSAKAFADHELLPMIQRELAETAIDPSNLVLEVTETAAIANLDEARRFIETLQAMGCKFALDDFGVGFSSFAHLKYLPVDYLKIDGSFIRELSRNVVDQHLVQAIVDVARSLGKQTIAEFVNDDDTVYLLQKYGVDFAQGFHIGRPRPLEEILSAPTVAA
jgi:EAL domain-containing protein (putative c-di-GMP-specific phosphodiesterase class I)